MAALYSLFVCKQHPDSNLFEAVILASSSYNKMLQWLMPVSVSPLQEVRNHVARLMLRCTIKELFDWRFMQTDPNWGNFLFDRNTGI